MDPIGKVCKPLKRLETDIDIEIVLDKDNRYRNRYFYKG